MQKTESNDRMPEYSINETEYLNDLLYLPRFCSVEPVDTFLSHEATRIEGLSDLRS